MPVKLNSTGGGSVTLDAPNTAATYTLTLPAANGSVATTTGTLTNPTINGFTGDTSVINVGSGQFYKDTSGNVGIGTSSPIAKVHVKADADILRLQAQTLNSSIYQTIYTYDGVRRMYQGYAGSGTTVYSLFLEEAGSQLLIGTANNERMRIDGSGNVGIGTSSPSARLDVAAPQSTLYLRSTGSFNSTLNFYSSSSALEASIVSLAGGASLLFATGSSGTERARITNDGTFLIGSTSQLVAGANHQMTLRYPGGGTRYGLGFRPDADNTRVITFANASDSLIGSITTSTTATAYNTSSDYRLKENVKPMQNALEKVALLNPVTYTWKADGSEGQGFIAHELQAVVPDAVTGEKDAVDKDGNPRYQGVDTSFLVATLTKAIQEQQAQLEALTARIAQLEAK